MQRGPRSTPVETAAAHPHLQVELRRSRRNSWTYLVGHANMHRSSVGLGVDGHCLHTQLAGGANDTTRDLTTVGNQDLVEWLFRMGLAVRVAQKRSTQKARGRLETKTVES